MDEETDIFNLFTWDHTRSALKKLEKLLQCNACGKVAVNATGLGRCDHFFCQSCIGGLDNGICPTCLIPSPPCDNKPDRIVMSLIESSRDLLNLLPKEDGNSFCGEAGGDPGRNPCTPPQQIRTASRTQTLQSLRIFQNSEQINIQKVDKVESDNQVGINNKKGSLHESKTELKKAKPNTEKAKTVGRKSPVADVNGSVSSRAGFFTPTAKQRVVLESPDLSSIDVNSSAGACNSTITNSNINKKNTKGKTSQHEPKKAKTNTGKTKPLDKKSPSHDMNQSVPSRSGFLTPDGKVRGNMFKPQDLSVLGVSPSAGAGNNSMRENPHGNINKRNTKGETMLHVSCVKGDVEKVRNLLKGGARPNTKDNAGWTPLHEVCQHGSWDLAKLLLDHGAIIDAPGPCNETPLLDAVINGRDDLIRLLRSYGASDSTIDIFGRTPRTIADRCIAAGEMHEALDTKRDTTLKLPPINPVMYDKMVLLGSGLKPENSKNLEKLSKLLRVRLATDYSQDVTHIVAETQTASPGVCQRTIKYMTGLVAGKWIISHKWVDECLVVGGPVNPVPYEIQGTSGNDSSKGPAVARDNTAKMNPGLFNGCHMYLHGNFRDPYPCKKDMDVIIRAGGGVVLVREPNPEAITQMEQTVPFHATPGSPLSECSHYVIYQEGSMEPQLKYTMKHIKSLPLAWIMSCIDHYRLIDPFN